MNTLVNVTDSERRLAERVNPDVTGGLSVSSQAGGLALSNMGEAMEMAKLMALSQVAIPKHLRGNPGACLAVVIQAVEWRMSPYAVANKSYSVNDRLAYESQLVQAVILQRAPIRGRFKLKYAGEGSKRTCTVSATLIDGDTVDYTSPEIGKIPVQNSPLWKADPDQQLFYYSGRALCRRHFPDVLLGVYAMDEIERDPEEARDITPRPRTLAGRLDALAQGLRPSGDETAHDPETGEITEQAGNDAPANEAPANGPVPSQDGLPAERRQGKDGGDNAPRGDREAPPPSDPSADDFWVGLDPASPKGKVIASLKEAAALGMGTLKKKRGALPDAAIDLLSDADHDELERVAGEADAKGDGFPGDR
jgi:hypothetical protein